MNVIEARGIGERLIVEGTFQLTSPAHVGNGDDTESLDMPLMRHPIDGRPFVSGDSVAGAMRAYLDAFEFGYRRKQKPSDAAVSLAVRLLGGPKDFDPQSALMVDDMAIVGGESPASEVRDRVGLHGASGTALASEEAKFDIELVSAGTRFCIRLELVMTRDMGQSGEVALRSALGLALEAFEAGEIRIGAGRSRGFGRGRVTDGWRVKEFNLQQSGLSEWIGWEPARSLAACGVDPCGAATFFPVLPADRQKDKREHVELTAYLLVEDSLLIRSNSPSREEPEIDGPDHVSQRRRSRGTWEYVVPGTGTAGALRARAWQIMNLHCLDQQKAGDLHTSIFGSRPREEPLTQSRLSVEEAVVPVGDGTPALAQVQAGVAIDMWTGATMSGALWFDQAIFAREAESAAVPASDEHAIRLVLRLINPQDKEVGLMLLLLKDLWTGDLPLGGEVGSRGGLYGLSASLVHRTGPEPPRELRLKRSGASGVEGNLAELEHYVAAFAALLPESAGETEVQV